MEEGNKSSMNEILWEDYLSGSSQENSMQHLYLYISAPKKDIQVPLIFITNLVRRTMYGWGKTTAYLTLVRPCLFFNGLNVVVLCTIIMQTVLIIPFQSEDL